MCVNGASREKRVFAIICVLVGSRLLAGNTKKTMPVSSFLTTYMARSWLKKNKGSIFPFMTLCGAFVEHHKVPSIETKQDGFLSLLYQGRSLSRSPACLHVNPFQPNHVQYCFEIRIIFNILQSCIERQAS